MEYWEKEGFSPRNAPKDLMCSKCDAWIRPDQVHVYLGSGKIWWYGAPAPVAHDYWGCDCDVCRKSYCPDCQEEQLAYRREHGLLGPEVPQEYYDIHRYGPVTPGLKKTHNIGPANEIL